MNSLIRYIALVIMFYTSYAMSQTTVDKIDGKIEELGTLFRDTDSNYIKYYDEFGIHLYSVLYFNSFNLLDEKQNSSLKYSPVISPSFGMGVTKYGFSLSISNDFGVIRQSEKKYGETNKFNINGSFLYKKMAFSAFFAQYKGFYVANPSDFSFWEGEEEYPQREDIKTTGFGLGYLHVFNKDRFSLNASYTLTQKQLKSAGTFLAGGYVNSFYISGDSSLISDEILNEFNPHIAIVNMGQYVVGLSAGYSYTLVFLKDFNFNLTATPGVLMAFTNLETEDSNYETDNVVDFHPSLAFKAALAYVKDRVYAGINSGTSIYKVNTGNNTGVSYNFLNIKLFVGYRLGSRKKKRKI